MGIADYLVRGRTLAGRVGVETWAAATMVRAGMVGLDGPTTVLGAGRALRRYGITGAVSTIAALRHGARTALVDERGPVSFTDLDDRSNALANALRARGVDADSGVGILCRNHRGMFDAMFACAKLGARTLLLNTDFAGPQLADVCAREGVQLVVHDEEFAEPVRALELSHGTVLAWHQSAPPGTDTVDGLIAAHSTAAPPAPRRTQRLVLLTSGTTGTPKGAQRHIGWSLIIPAGLVSKIPFRGSDVVYIAPPLFHAWGMLTSTVAFTLGATVVTRRRFDAETVLADLQRHGCTAVVLVPIMLSRILALGADVIAGYRLFRLRIIAMAGSRLTARLATRGMETFGNILYNLYGSTEVAYASIATAEDLRAAPGCAGRAPVGTVVKILDGDGTEVPQGQRGRIFVTNYIQFAGYTGGGDKERVGGLMSSGDVGYLDDDGRLFVEARDDDMIVSGGENVFPREIEELLLDHEAIADVAVIGIPDEEFGSRVAAYLVVESGHTIDADTVRDLVRSNLARYKVPREVRFVDELPRNAMGKVMTRELLQRPADSGQ